MEEKHIRKCEAVSENVTFATEILRELKRQSERWFVAFLITLVALIVTIFFK